MYGQIHCCIRSLILEKFGKETWEKIIETSKIDEVNDFMVFHQYSDEPTMRLIASVAKVADLDIEIVLEVFGEYFLEYCLKHGYDKMLVTLGGTFEMFIQNLDSLHALLQLSYKNIQAPSFRCVSKGDGVLDLHYYSYRNGLYPIVKGLVREVGRRLFDCKVTCEVLCRTEDISSVIFGVDGHSFKEYVKFELHIIENNPVKSTVPAPSNQMRTASAVLKAPKVNGIPSVAPLSPKVFCAVFPFHILFDEHMTIAQVGDGLVRVCPYFYTALDAGNMLKMSDMFEMIHPMMSICYTNIEHFMNAVFLLQLKPQPGINTSSLVLKGQIVPEPTNHKFFFIGSPRIESLSDLKTHNIYLSDIPIYDVTRELVLLNHQRIAEIEVSKKLDETTAQLKMMAIELENEKAKTDRLLHEMLPKKVADQLKQGKSVEAEKFAEVTIFFSDIVTFTDIASASTPMAIVGMLNELYARFDELSSTHDVYKVETIGDAYMVVSGVPEPNEDHAMRVADFALGAVQAARQVKSPATGTPLQIRVGLHTGPVVAGVVGVRMPRYCLFGDTVNTASRMESHGIPECIHCSHSTYRALMKAEGKYIFSSRGETFIKGKGLMHTYFITSNGLTNIGEVPTAALKRKISGESAPSVASDEAVRKPSENESSSAVQESKIDSSLTSEKPDNDWIQTDDERFLNGNSRTNPAECDLIPLDIESCKQSSRTCHII